ncbi:hypothetical protein BU25DRAFT_424878 [Macroventuria anomochaeta]|uniref:Uncharacterized protein n=1 Tax=Macroventuria anomochaeta TaxID=301207 RepID=A0ACB6RNQ8_9PLEO|nr:uncharacterized protein BU25DRAFT_424878 [Macroventuria anomochaeta]KAF2623357.1 hypothetical protein BU25DRAFT_424878 [Macroventuria anomochaeta]
MMYSYLLPDSTVAQDCDLIWSCKQIKVELSTMIVARAREVLEKTASDGARLGASLSAVNINVNLDCTTVGQTFPSQTSSLHEHCPLPLYEIQAGLKEVFSLHLRFVTIIVAIKCILINARVTIFDLSCNTFGPYRDPGFHLYIAFIARRLRKSGRVRFEFLGHKPRPSNRGIAGINGRVLPERWFLVTVEINLSELRNRPRRPKLWEREDIAVDSHPQCQQLEQKNDYAPTKRNQLCAEECSLLLSTARFVSAYVVLLHDSATSSRAAPLRNVTLEYTYMREKYPALDFKIKIPKIWQLYSTEIERTIDQPGLRSVNGFRLNKWSPRERRKLEEIRIQSAMSPFISVPPAPSFGRSTIPSPQPPTASMFLPKLQNAPKTQRKQVFETPPPIYSRDNMSLKNQRIPDESVRTSRKESIELYILAERLQGIETKNTVIDGMFLYLREAIPMFPTTPVAKDPANVDARFFKWLYECTPENSPARRLAVDFYAQTGRAEFAPFLLFSNGILTAVQLYV